MNLLSSRDHEALLSNAYRDHIRNANAQLFEDGTDNIKHEGEIGYSEFDFHSKVKLAGGIESVRDNIRRDPETGGKIDQFGYCLAGITRYHNTSNANKKMDGGEKTKTKHDEEEVFESLIAKQEGVFRVNCLDCLE